MSVAISPEKELGKTKSPGGFLGVHHLTPLTIVEQGFWGNPGTVGARSLRGIWPSGMILGEEVDVSSASLPSAPGLLMPRNVSPSPDIFLCKVWKILGQRSHLVRKNLKAVVDALHSGRY